MEANSPYKVGDHVSIEEWETKRWWQFWLPEKRLVKKKYVCVYTGPTGQYVDEWKWEE